MSTVGSIDGAEALVGLVIVSHAAKVADGTLELLDPAQAAHVRLNHGPVVEGAIIAAIQASIRDDLQAVCDAADAMLTRARLAR